MAEKLEGKEIDPGEIEVVFAVLRAEADASGYGMMISDDKVRTSAVAVVTALENYRNAPAI